MKINKALVGAVAIGALAIPAAVVPALAQDNGGSSTTTTQPAQPAQSAKGAHKGHRGGAHQKRRQARADALAKKLGISVDQLKAAVKQARTHKPAQPITDKAQRKAYWEGQIASALGISVDTLKAAELSSRVDVLSARLDQAVSKGRMTRDQADKILNDAKAGTFPHHH